LKHEPSQAEVERAAAKRAKAKVDGAKVEHRADAGTLCPQCAKPTELRWYATITPSMRNRPYYMARWSVCRNPECRQQTMIALPEDVVFRADIGPEERERLLSIVARKMG
jgi:hypothetical protein